MVAKKTIAKKVKLPGAKSKPKAVKPAKEKEKTPIVKPMIEEGNVQPEAADGVEKESKAEKYYEAVGRRKEATARVRVYTKKSTDLQPSEDQAIIVINDKPYFEYFNSPALQEMVDAPLKKLKSLNRFKATVKVKGGGMAGQADAIKFGLSRALVLFDPNFSKKLRKAGYLTRDSREKERRKYGLKKARKAPAWSKR